MVRIQSTLLALSLAAALGTCADGRAQVAAAAAAGAVAVAPHLAAAAPAILTGAVSSATAHAGSAVLAKLASPAALSNGLKLPAGTQMLGRVTQASPLKSGKGTSSLSMLFDRVKLPDGKEQPIAPSILSHIGSGSSTDRSSQADATAVARANARPSGNAGLLGGVVGGVSNAVGATSEAVTSTAGQALGAVTGLPGILLNSNGALAAQGRNVDVPAGTQISVQASAAAAAQ